MNTYTYTYTHTYTHTTTTHRVFIVGNSIFNSLEKHAFTHKCFFIIFLQATSHKGHNWCPIEEEVNDFRKRLNERRDEFKQEIEDEQKYQEQLQKYNKEFLLKEQTVKQELRKYIREVTSQRRRTEAVNTKIVL